MKTEMVFETSVSTKAEPHYPAENPEELHENSLVRIERIVLLDFIHRLVSQEQTKLRN
jgi:hypothetical protein